MMAVTPASASASRPSRNGKNASEAATAPLASSPACSTAMRAEFTRFGWPPPTPMVAWPFVMAMALDLMDLHTFHANSSSASSSSLGWRFVGTVNVAGSSATASESWASRPPSTERYSTSPPAGFTPPVDSRRAFFFALYMSSASPANSGAMMASTNCLLSKMATTTSEVTGRLNAMTPP